MRRKLIKQGGGGFTIYLPKKWIDRKGLSSGEEVEISDDGVNLIVGTAVRQRKEATIEVTDQNRADLETLLSHMYRNGMDSVRIIGLDEPGIGRIEKFTAESLLGFEVTDRTPGGCTIENISEPTDEKYDALLRRIFLMVKEMHNVVTEDFTSSRLERMGAVSTLRTQQDRFVLFCRRVLIREKYEHNPVLDWELLTFLMHFQHSYYYIYKTALDRKIKPGAEVNEYLAGLKGYYELFYQAFTKEDISSIHRLNSLRRKYHFGGLLDSMAKGKGDQTILLSQIRELYRLIQVGASPILSRIVEKTSQ